jgi:hypothetical protein
MPNTGEVTAWRKTTGYPVQRKTVTPVRGCLAEKVETRVYANSNDSINVALLKSH